MSLYDDLKRRNVIRVSIAYLAGAWLLVQIVETLFPMFDVPGSVARTIVIAFAIGFVPVVTLSWIFEWTPEGLVTDEPGERPADAPRDQRRFDHLVIALLILD